MASELTNAQPNLDLPAVDPRIQHISQVIKDNDKSHSKALPGLADLLDDYLDPKTLVTSEDFIRRLLRVFHHSTDNTYEDILDGYTDDEKAVLKAFVKGKSANEIGQDLKYTPSLAARQELGHLHDASLSECIKDGLEEVKEEVQEWFGKEAHNLQAMTHHTKAIDIGLREDKGTLEVSLDIYESGFFVFSHLTRKEDG